ncbi:MAG: hypothetical protein LBU89_14095, partial [Fibromonadaceae bacterium]|jgi:hypothetical protein|nr:hypothetical protein [Fibromonadaceae bacterium]
MGGSLWGTDTEKFAALQVQTPAVLACKQREGENYWSSACRGAGWWFGYTYPAEDKAQVEVEINGAYTDGTAIFELAPDGESLISNAFKIKFAAVAAELHESGEYMNTNGAGVVFHFKVGEEAENISSKGGFCVSYTSTASVVLEIASTAVTDNNNWIVELPASASKRVANFPWNNFRSSWDQLPISITDVTTTATSIRITLRNDTTAPRSADFALMQLGWAGECN